MKVEMFSVTKFAEYKKKRYISKSKSKVFIQNRNLHGKKNILTAIHDQD